MSHDRESSGYPNKQSGSWRIVALCAVFMIGESFGENTQKKADTEQRQKSDVDMKHLKNHIDLLNKENARLLMRVLDLGNQCTKLREENRNLKAELKLDESKRPKP